MDKDEANSKKDAYVEYLTSKLNSAFSLKEWHEQTFGETLTDHEVTDILGEHHTRGAADFRMSAHQHYMRINR